MRIPGNLVAQVVISVLACAPCGASHLVTGNGFGFAVVAPESGTVTKFYAHPYSFVRPDPANPFSEGIETASFIKSLGWGEGTAGKATADYNDDSHLIHIRRSDGEGLCFMPFGFTHAALIISWQPASADPQAGGFRVEWNHPVRSQKVVGNPGAEMRLLSFDGFEESMLLIPLEKTADTAAASAQVLAGSRAWALISLESEDDPEHTAADFNRWRAGLAPQALAKRELDELEHWRVKPPVQFASDNERHVWRQSEVMLRIAQSREPNRPGRNNNGLMVASLPDGVWFTPWVRDMAWATVALARMGHQSEARAALLAYFNAQPTGKMSADTQAPTTRFPSSGTSATARKSPFSPRKAAPTSSSMTGEKCCGRWENTCANMTTLLSSLCPLTVAGCMRAPGTTS